MPGASLPGPGTPEQGPPRGRAAEIQLLHWRREQDCNEVSSQLTENAVLRRCVVCCRSCRTGTVSPRVPLLLTDGPLRLRPACRQLQRLNAHLAGAQEDRRRLEDECAVLRLENKVGAPGGGWRGACACSLLYVFVLAPRVYRLRSRVRRARASACGRAQVRGMTQLLRNQVLLARASNDRLDGRGDQASGVGTHDEHSTGIETHVLPPWRDPEHAGLFPQSHSDLSAQSKRSPPSVSAAHPLLHSSSSSSSSSSPLSFVSLSFPPSAHRTPDTALTRCERGLVGLSGGVRSDSTLGTQAPHAPAGSQGFRVDWAEGDGDAGQRGRARVAVSVGGAGAHGRDRQGAAAKDGCLWTVGGGGNGAQARTYGCLSEPTHGGFSEAAYGRCSAEVAALRAWSMGQSDDDGGLFMVSWCRVGAGVVACHVFLQGGRRPPRERGPSNACGSLFTHTYAHTCTHTLLRMHTHKHTLTHSLARSLAYHTHTHTHKGRCGRMGTDTPVPTLPAPWVEGGGAVCGGTHVHRRRK